MLTRFLLTVALILAPDQQVRIPGPGGAGGAAAPSVTDPALVDNAANINNSNTTTITVTPTVNLAIGDVAVVGLGWDTNGHTVTCADTSGNTYSDAGGGSAHDSTNPTWGQVFISKITAGAGTKPVITCTWNSTLINKAVNYLRFSGIDGTTQVDSFCNTDVACTNTNNAPSFGSLFAAGTLSTTNKNLACIANTVTARSTKFPGPNWTSPNGDQGTADENVMLEWRLFHASGGHNPSFVQGSSSGGADTRTTNIVCLKSADQTSFTPVDNGNTMGILVSSATTTWSWTDVVPTGVSNYVAFVDIYSNGTTSVSSITYGGSSMTLVQSTCGVTNLECHRVYDLIAPSTGNNTVSITMASSETGGAFSFSTFNTNQTTPATSIQSDGGFTGTTSALTVTSSTGDYVFSGMGVADKSACISAPLIFGGSYIPAGTPEVFFGHAPGAASVNATWTIIATNTLPSSCPGTPTGSIERTHIAFNIKHS